ncbi:hypothetical protein SDC9_41243 [bioreactor metagenome]|uniref:Uncharacterized protein n=1 Tax=bioreactor metagenome TaxID=1076179 RepID=A0A644VV31_9ZZZZ
MYEIENIFAAPIDVDGICVVKPILLSEFKRPGATEKYQKYRQYLSILAMSSEDILEMFKENKIISDYDKSAVSQFSQFDLFTSIPYFRELFHEALSFFVVEELSWSDTIKSFLVSGKDLGAVVNGDVYKKVRRAILESNYINIEDETSEAKVANSRAKSILEKLAAGRKKKAVAQASKSPPLDSIISSVCTYSNGYTLLNIGDLSVYQLFDQFMRLGSKVQLDTFSLRWAAWGKDPFDFTLWYKNLKGEN